MVEGEKDSDEFEKINLSGFNSESSPGDLSELIVGVMQVFVFEESLLKIKKKKPKNNPYICRALCRQLKINFDNHVIKKKTFDVKKDICSTAHCTCLWSNYHMYSLVY